MSEIWYQLSPNLFLDGNKVFSYNTHVAEIKENRLEVFGKYTRTTSKHIYHVSRIFDLPVEINKDKQKDFYKLPMGMAAVSPKEKCLSQKTSLFILGKLGPNPTRETWFNHLGDLPQIPALDWAFICLHLGIDTKQKQPHKPDPCWASI
jgi:hypothetical protein